MAKKKKDKEEEYSKYQKDIFDYIEHGQGHLVIEAAAGSGKTFTLIKCLELIPQNKRIREMKEIEKAEKNPEFMRFVNGLKTLVENDPKVKDVVEKIVRSF